MEVSERALHDPALGTEAGTTATTSAPAIHEAGHHGERAPTKLHRNSVPSGMARHWLSGGPAAQQRALCDQAVRQLHQALTCLGVVGLLMGARIRELVEVAARGGGEFRIEQ